MPFYIHRTSLVKHIHRFKIGFAHLHIHSLKPFSKQLAVESARIETLPFIALPKLTASNLHFQKHLFLHTNSTSWFVFQKNRTRPCCQKQTRRVRTAATKCHSNDTASGKASNNTDTDMNTSVMRQFDQMVAIITSRH